MATPNLYSWPAADRENVMDILDGVAPAVGTGWQGWLPHGVAMAPPEPTGGENPTVYGRFDASTLGSLPGFTSSATAAPVRRRELMLWVIDEPTAPIGIADTVYAATLTALEAAQGTGGLTFLLQEYSAPSGFDTTQQPAGFRVRLGTLPFWGTS